MRKCQYCAEEIQDEAIICRYCGEKVAEDRNPPDTRKKKLFQILPIFLLLLLLPTSGWSIYTYISRLNTSHQNDLNQLNSQNSELISQLSQAESELAATQKDLLTTEQGLSTSLADLELINQKVVSLTQELENATATQTALDSKYDRLNKTNSENVKQLMDLQALLCTDYKSIKLDYTSNATISLALANYVKGLDVKYQRATYNTIWSDSKTATHRILATQDNRSVAFNFIVYFNEEGFTEKGVYWINQQCWLDK